MNWLKRVKEVAIERNDSMPDKEFFSSKEYSALTQRFAQNMVGGVRSYLARQGYFITPQQEKKLIESTRVNVIYDDSKGAVAAFTDGCNITINAGNELVTKNAHRPTQHYAIQGFRAHEQGHQLFTDFPTIKAWFNELESARWWPANLMSGIRQSTIDNYHWCSKNCSGFTRCEEYDAIRKQLPAPLQVG